MASSKSPVAEAIVIALALLIFLLYHVWAFFITGHGCLTAQPESRSVNGKGRVARVVFASNICSNEKFAILGVQHARNGMMGVSFQSGVAAIFFNVLLTLLLDTTQLQFVSTFSRRDPLLDDEPSAPATDSSTPMIGIVSVRAVVLVNMCIMLTALMLFVVCVRLYVHMGYFYGAATNKEQEWIQVQDAVEVTLHAQMMYTTGQRVMFFFPITVIWLLGPLAMLCTSVAVTSCVAYVDRWDPRWKSNYQTVLQNIRAPSMRKTQRRWWRCW